VNAARILAALAVAVVAAGTWSLHARTGAEPGPLSPLAWLVGGEWRPEVEGSCPARSFAWSSAGLVLRERREDSNGAPAGEVIYHWHHEKSEVALYGVLPEAHFEGVLRTAPDGALEIQWRLYEGADEPTFYREYLRPAGPSRLFWTLRQRQGEEEILTDEAILVRR
jgi:hypothetical protein